HHTAPPPHLGDVGQVHLVLVVLGVAERRRLGVDGAAPPADVGVGEDVEALGVGGHHAVLHAVVDHLDEVPGAALAAVQVPLLGGAPGLLAAGRARDRSAPGGEGLEDGVEARDRGLGAADHQAVPALEAPHAAAGAGVDVVDAAGGQRLGAPDVVD